MAEKKKASDFRYNTGETKVPWAAPVQNYNAQDVMACIRFLMQGSVNSYDAAIRIVERDIQAPVKASMPPMKLSPDSGVNKAETMTDRYLGTTGSTFVTNCGAGWTGKRECAKLKIKSSHTPHGLTAPVRPGHADFV